MPSRRRGMAISVRRIAFISSLFPPRDGPAFWLSLATPMPVRVDHLSQQLANLPFLPSIVVGLLLLFLGRKLFWLFVGAVGFLVGVEVAATLFPHQPDWSLIVGLILGLIGAVIAIFVQKISI